jgi:hypothetical protein
MKTITTSSFLIEIVWEISFANATTTLQMMHRGLVPGVECYERCKSGWDFYVATAC